MKPSDFFTYFLTVQGSSILNSIDSFCFLKNTENFQPNLLEKKPKVIVKLWSLPKIVSTNFLKLKYHIFLDSNDSFFSYILRYQIFLNKHFFNVMIRFVYRNVFSSVVTDVKPFLCFCDYNKPIFQCNVQN